MNLYYLNLIPTPKIRRPSLSKQKIRRQKENYTKA